MNFILCEMNYLRYFIPIIIEGNSRGVSSKVFVSWDWPNKYNAPSKHKKSLLDLSSRYNFSLENISNWSSDGNDHPTFFIEGVGLNSGPKIRKNSKDQKFICITYMADYENLYSGYVDLCDYVVFPSRSFAEEFNTVSEKNLYFGSPKYDIDFCVNQNRDKLTALVIHPDSAASSSNVGSVHKILRENDFNILVKTRGKTPVNDKSLRGDRYYVDESWFPHTTMELISKSDLVINFDSSVIKECVMLEKPVLNFNALGNRRVYKFLYGHEFCVDYPKNESDSKKIHDGIFNLVGQDFSHTYQQVKNDYMWSGNASMKILDFLWRNNV